ncbi:MAG: hypothetical protein ACFN4S_11380 [Prevotella conceptionensis]
MASDCGFADVKAFNAAFKKHFNMTPTESRSEHAVRKPERF